MLNRFVNARTVLVVFLLVNSGSVKSGMAADDSKKQIEDAKKRLWSEAKAGRDEVPQVGGEWSNIVDGKAVQTINIVQKGDKFTATCSYQHPKEGEIRWSLTATITKEGHISGRMVHTKSPKGWKNQQHIAVLSAEGDKIKGAVIFDGGGGHDYLWTLSKAAVVENTDPAPARSDIGKKADQSASGSEKPTASNSSPAKKPSPDEPATKDIPPENPGKNAKGHLMAKAGQPFKYQMPPDKKRTDYRLVNGPPPPDGMKITDEGLITWNPGVELSGVFNIMVSINGGQKLERLKIEVEPATAAAIAAYKKAPTAAAGDVPGLTDRPGYGYIPLGVIGGWVMLADEVTLVVSLPEEGRLVYFDTLANKQLKDVEVDFKPGPLALQGKTLFAGGQGGSIVFALDSQTGKELRQFTLGGNAIARLACHPEKGPVFASTTNYGIYALNPDTGKVSKTKAAGYFLAVDPISGGFLYSGIQPPVEGEYIISREADGALRIAYDRWGKRSMLMKYAVSGNGLRLVSSQNNAAVNGRDMHLTPDGKKLMISGGGGWRPLKDEAGGGYVLAVFGTDNLEGMLGQAPLGGNTVFHPVLNIGVTNHFGLDLTIFNAKSFVVKYGIHMSKEREDRPLLLTFGAKGTKIVLWNGTNAAKSRGLHLVPLDLSDDDKKTLEQARNKTTAASDRNSTPRAVAQAGEPDATTATDEAPADEKPASDSQRPPKKKASAKSEEQPRKTAKADGQLAAASTSVEAKTRIAGPIIGKQPGQERDDNESKITLVWCPPGKFKMGSSKSEKGRVDDREGQVDVTLTKGFWLGKYEVTQSEWMEGMATETWQGKEFTKAGDNFPATWINWDDAMKFCAAMTERERAAGRLPDGWEYSLPTEAQWEYACRAGATTRFSFGDDESKLGQYAWFQNNTSLLNEKFAHEACEKKPNAWGFHDMHGNVCEWCRDRFVKTLPGGIDPEATSGGSSRVVRSTSFKSIAGDCRSARRAGAPAAQRVNDIGFRVALCPTASK